MMSSSMSSRVAKNRDNKSQRARIYFGRNYSERSTGKSITLIDLAHVHLIAVTTFLFLPFVFHLVLTVTALRE